MILIAGIMVLASCMPYLASATFAPPPQVGCYCPMNYDPVCGTDGITYSNECVMNCVSAENERRGLPSILRHHAGPCERYACRCTTEYKPVCGDNNHTYTNDCWLACTNRQKIKDNLPIIKIAYRTACSSSSCICPDCVIPVCGTDGKTYKNVCTLQYYSRIIVVQHKPPIYVAKPGACEVEICYCRNIPDEICASNNKTYLNKCFLDCENRRRDQLEEKLLEIQYIGPCSTACVCPKNSDPICANDDVTYGNECLFNCENTKRARAGLPKLFKRWGGSCDCGCDNRWNPLCASNGITFANSCWLNCENQKRQQDEKKLLFKTSRGECRSCPCDYCPQYDRPVCDNENKTHKNLCYFDCNNDCLEAAGLKKRWIRRYERCLF